MPYKATNLCYLSVIYLVIYLFLPSFLPSVFPSFHLSCFILSSNVFAQRLSSHTCLGSSVSRQTLHLLCCGGHGPSLSLQGSAILSQAQWEGRGSGVRPLFPCLEGLAQSSGRLCAILVRRPKLCSVCNRE